MAKMDDERWKKQAVGLFSSSSSSLPSSPSSSIAFKQVDLGAQHLAMSGNSRKRLLKQLSMRETPRDILGKRRRRQILRQGQKVKNGANETDPVMIMDEDPNELRSCIELGFGFKEGEGQRVCCTLVALDLYFTVNRQLSPSLRASDHHSHCSSSSLERENPQLVKTRLRLWAQAVACSVRQAL